MPIPALLAVAMAIAAATAGVKLADKADDKRVEQESRTGDGRDD